MPVIESIRKKLDEEEYTADVFVYLKKAFDTVNHEILIDKIEEHCVRGVAKEEFCLYLKNIEQFVP